MGTSVDMFLKLDGIKGESQDSKHPGEIELDSFEWGVNNIGSAGRGGGLGSGKAQFTDFKITKLVDAGSPVLMETVATGKPIGSGLLTLRKAGGTQLEYCTIKFTNLMVSDYHVHGTGDEAVPIESISLNYSKVEIKYTQQKPDGTGGPVSQGGYDIVLQKKA